MPQRGSETTNQEEDEHGSSDDDDDDDDDDGGSSYDSRSRHDGQESMSGSSYISDEDRSKSNDSYSNQGSGSDSRNSGRKASQRRNDRQEDDSYSDYSSRASSDRRSEDDYDDNEDDATGSYDRGDSKRRENESQQSNDDEGSYSDRTGESGRQSHSDYEDEGNDNDEDGSYDQSNSLQRENTSQHSHEEGSYSDRTGDSERKSEEDGDSNDRHDSKRRESGSNLSYESGSYSDHSRGSQDDYEDDEGEGGSYDRSDSKNKAKHSKEEVSYDSSRSRESESKSQDDYDDDEEEDGDSKEGSYNRRDSKRQDNPSQKSDEDGSYSGHSQESERQPDDNEDGELDSYDHIDSKRRENTSHQSNEEGSYSDRSQDSERRPDYDNDDDGDSEDGSNNRSGPKQRQNTSQNSDDEGSYSDRSQGLDRQPEDDYDDGSHDRSDSKQRKKVTQKSMHADSDSRSSQQTGGKSEGDMADEQDTYESRSRGSRSANMRSRASRSGSSRSNGSLSQESQSYKSERSNESQNDLSVTSGDPSDYDEVSRDGLSDDKAKSHVNFRSGISGSHGTKGSVSSGKSSGRDSNLDEHSSQEMASQIDSQAASKLSHNDLDSQMDSSRIESRMSRVSEEDLSGSDLDSVGEGVVADSDDSSSNSESQQFSRESGRSRGDQNDGSDAEEADNHSRAESEPEDCGQFKADGSNSIQSNGSNSLSQKEREQVKPSDTVESHFLVSDEIFNVFDNGGVLPGNQEDSKLDATVFPDDANTRGLIGKREDEGASEDGSDFSDGRSSPITAIPTVGRISQHLKDSVRPASESSVTETSSISDIQQLGVATQFFPGQEKGSDFIFRPETAPTENSASFACDGDEAFGNNALGSYSGASLSRSLGQSESVLTAFEDTDVDEIAPTFPGRTVNLSVSAPIDHENRPVEVKNEIKQDFRQRFGKNKDGLENATESFRHELAPLHVSLKISQEGSVKGLNEMESDFIFDDDESSMPSLMAAKKSEGDESNQARDAGEALTKRTLGDMLSEHDRVETLGDGEKSVRSHTSALSAASRRSMIGKQREEMKKRRKFSGYTREQMQKLIQVNKRETGDDESEESSISAPGQTDQKKGKGRRGRMNGKSTSLIDLVAKVNDAMAELDTKLAENAANEIKGPSSQKETEAQVEDEEDEEIKDLAKKILKNFEELVGVLLQLSDEQELLSTFAKHADPAAIEALKILISHARVIDEIFGQLQPILIHYLTKEMDEEMEDFLYGVKLIVEQITEICCRVGEKQQWNARANTSFLTLLELLARDALEISCIYDDVDTPPYSITKEIQQAWEATGHDEEAKTLLVTSDLALFRQICYEVMLSCDQWCPDTDALLDICAIEENEDDEPPPQSNQLVMSPEAALQILEKINGEPLPRITLLASVLRRILPPEAVTDTRLKDSFAKIRGAVRNPMGLSPSTLVSISSIPEDPDNEESLGVAGVGKSTVAAMVANHPDVRRFFRHGIAWVYIGPTELNYTRYVQCLQDLIGQLENIGNEEPLFPELLHTPGESNARRRRREEGFMIFVRETMVEFLESKNVLIVLDDVCFDPDLDWFDFSPPIEAEEDEEGSCVVLVTSRRRSLLPAADTVEVEMLDLDEGTRLFVKESGALSKILLQDAPEIRSVVRECAGHPLAIKSLARWLHLKHAPDGSPNSTTEEVHLDIVSSMDRILKDGNQEQADTMYGILNLSMSPVMNGKPTNIVKLCFAAFVKVFCDRKFISDFALADSPPIVPLSATEALFEALLDLEDETFTSEGIMVYASKKQAAKLIPEALLALGIFRVIITLIDDADTKTSGSKGSKGQQQNQEEKYFQIMHIIQEEYGEYLFEEGVELGELVKDGERRWNRAFAQVFMARGLNWDDQTPDAGLDYALEAMPSHLYRGGLLTEAEDLVCNSSFVGGRLFALGRENGTRRHIHDCETLFDLMTEQRLPGKKKYDPKGMMRDAYETLGELLYMEEDDLIREEGSPEAVEVGRSHFDLGFSLAERRCWDGAIYHWEKSQELLVSALGMVELVAAVLFNVGVVYAEMHEYEQALVSLKQCLKIRGAIHGEEHILYAQTIQKIGDIFLSMSDYHEAMESFNWALDVMHIEPSHHRIDIGDILENLGNIHYSKGEIADALRCFQDALRSKQVDLGENHPELSTTFQSIGNCLSDQGKTEEAIAHFEEAIRLKNLDPEGGSERDAEILIIQGILSNLHGKQKEGLASYEKALQVLVTRAPHRKEKVASLLHLIGCVYLISGEHRKAMKLFEESLQARRKVLGFVHLDVASTLFNMAFLHQSRKRLDKALKCLEEALKIRQLRLPDSEKVAVTHEKIGTISRALGKTKKAELAFNEALRIRRLVHGDMHHAVAAVLQELGDLMGDLGDSDAAMKNYVQALEIREQRLGPDDLAVAETYYSMGFNLMNSHALDRALQCFEESLSIRKFNLGDDAKEVGDTLNMMGSLQAQRDELDDAISLLWEALRIRKHHKDNVKVSETLKNIGNVHREKREYELAIECYDNCLKIRRSELGDNHEKVAEALIAMGIVHGDMNSSTDAMECYKEGKMAINLSMVYASKKPPILIVRLPSVDNSYSFIWRAG